MITAKQAHEIAIGKRPVDAFSAGDNPRLQGYQSLILAVALSGQFQMYLAVDHETKPMLELNGYKLSGEHPVVGGGCARMLVKW